MTPPPGVLARYGDLDDFTRAALPGAVEVQVLDLRRVGSHLDCGAIGGAVILGSPASVRDEVSHIGAKVTEAILHSGAPLLGICYGFELIAAIWGWLVVDDPDGFRIGRFRQTITSSGEQDLLLRAAAGGRRNFLAFEIHREIVLQGEGGAETLACDDRGLPSAVRFSEEAWGVQFHPEMRGEIVNLYRNVRLGMQIGGAHATEDTEIELGGQRLLHAFTAML